MDLEQLEFELFFGKSTLPNNSVVFRQNDLPLGKQVTDEKVRNGTNKECENDKGSPPPTPVEDSCIVCFEKITPEREYLMKHKCEATVCKECLARKIESQIMDKQMAIKCPSGCGFTLDYYEVKGCLKDLEILEKYETLALQLNLTNMEDFCTCPTPDCHLGGFLSPSQPWVVCCRCEFRYCPTCRLEWHENMTCEQFRSRDSNAVDGNKGTRKFTEYSGKSTESSHRECTVCEDRVCLEEYYEQPHKSSENEIIASAERQQQVQILQKQLALLQRMQMLRRQHQQEQNGLVKHIEHGIVSNPIPLDCKPKLQCQPIFVNAKAEQEPQKQQVQHVEQQLQVVSLDLEHLERPPKPTSTVQSPPQPSPPKTQEQLQVSLPHKQCSQKTQRTLAPSTQTTQLERAKKPKTAETLKTSEKSPETVSTEELETWKQQRSQMIMQKKAKPIKKYLKQTNLIDSSFPSQHGKQMKTLVQSYFVPPEFLSVIDAQPKHPEPVKEKQPIAAQKTLPSTPSTDFNSIMEFSNVRISPMSICFLPKDIDQRNVNRKRKMMAK